MRFDAEPGSVVRIEGTSSIHDWQVEGKLIGGYVEAGKNFPVEPGQAVQPGEVEAQVEAFIPVGSLHSIEKDGKPYSTKMDEIMHEKLKRNTSPKISYHLTNLILKGSPQNADAPYTFNAIGELVVAGMTNIIAMPVNITPLGDKKLKISGNIAVKMTDFKIQPPAPAIALGLIKTGDQVKLSFTWLVGQRATSPK